MDAEPEKPLIGRTHAQAWVVAAVGVLIFAIALIFILPSSSSDESTKFPRGIGFPNADKSNTRFAQGPIHANSVSDLALTWRLPESGGGSTFGAYNTSPVVVGGVVYSQDLNSNVQAIDLENGEVLWEAPYEASSRGPNGVFVANGHVYGATTTGAFALDQESGREVWATTLVQGGAEEVTMAPGYHDGLILISTLGTQGGGVGTLWALDAKTGERA